MTSSTTMPKSNGSVRHGKKPSPALEVVKFIGDEFQSHNPVVSTISSPLNKNIFIPDWDNRPPQLPPVIQLGNTTILTSQNVSALIARPGGGKSSCMEAIIASFVNPFADCLGFAVDPSCRGIISLDFERTNNDVWNSWFRSGKRAGITQGETMPNVLFAGLRSVSKLNERKEFTIRMLENTPCSLLLFDGAGDLVNDTNDLDEAGACMDWLRELTVKYHISIFCTLHPNPGSDKPRGHLGSEICREAECVMLAKPFDDNTRIITCKGGEPMKNRNNPELTIAFKWGEGEGMFVSADFDEISAGKKSEKDEKKVQSAAALLKRIIAPPKSLIHKDFVEAIMKAKGLEERQAKTTVKNMLGWGLVEVVDNYYRLKI